MLAENFTSEVTAVEKVADNKIGEKRRALGRGLDTLLPGAPRTVPVAMTASAPTAAEPRPGQEVLQLKLDEVLPNPYQTRTRVDENYLEQLATSIRQHGVLQPVTVRPGPDGKYLLIAGECRWKASKLAGQGAIPAIVRVVSDQQALELTIIENLQREDLNCMDQAKAFQRLSEEFRLTQEQIALRTGLKRSTVSNYLRVMKLPEEIRDLLREGTLTFGHAKALMGLDEGRMIRIAEHAVKNLVSVRRLQELVVQMTAPLGEAQPVEPPYVDPNVREAQRELERILGVKALIRDRKGTGSIMLYYRSLGDFDRIMEMLKGE